MTAMVSACIVDVQTDSKAINIKILFIYRAMGAVNRSLFNGNRILHDICDEVKAVGHATDSRLVRRWVEWRLSPN